jgi:hypothetical protein
MDVGSEHDYGSSDKKTFGPLHVAYFKKLIVCPDM